MNTHGSYDADNTVTPKLRLNPYKEQSVERLMRSILFRMEALGFDLDQDAKNPEPPAPVFQTRRRGVKASGYYDSESATFTVLSGSQIDLTRPVLKNLAAAEERSRRFKDRRDIVVLDEDVEFTSPSAAAIFVLGGSQNG